MLSKFRKQATWCDQRNLRMGCRGKGGRKEGRRETRLKVVYVWLIGQYADLGVPLRNLDFIRQCVRCH